MNASRPVVSYDDITLPYSSVEADIAPPNANGAVSKKRKSNNKSKKRQNKRHQQANNHTQASYPSNDPGHNEEYDDEEGEGYYEEESRELTHQEIWDDSALIDAWNAASEEYEAFHGPDQGWKSEPVHKSPLWYNIPPEKVSNPPPQKKRKLDTEDTNVLNGGAEGDEEEEGNSKPINFDTFVPTHDPSLQAGGPANHAQTPNAYDIANIPGITSATPSAAGHLQELLSGGSMVSQDEAFSRALGAMYWGGYWTAMYHCQRFMGNQSQAVQSSHPPNEQVENDEGAYIDGEDELEEGEEGEEDDGFVSTQR